MPIPRIALVGRPNVGKSSIMNMVAARRVSITDDTPGTTRDRVIAIVHLEGPDPTRPPVKAELVDTGGYGVYTAEGRRIDDAGHDLAALTGDIERQIAAAVSTADLILFVVDAQAGLTAQDYEIARLLREGGIARQTRRGDGSPAAGARVLVVANKVDGPRWEAHAFEAAALGFGEPLHVSARNNYNRRHFVETLAEHVARLDAGRAEPPAPDELRLAIVGKRNAGKSTLVNTLAGEQRVIVSEIPGTTRDAVDVRFQMDGRTFVAIDTAGLRRKRSFTDRIEWFALERTAEAIARSDVGLLMIDATLPLSHVDQQVARMLAASFKPCIIVINKWDLAEGRPLAGRTGQGGGRVTTAVYEEYLRRELRQLWYAPIAFMSARDGRNVRETIDLAFELAEQSRQRVSTGRLNRLVRDIMQRRGPVSGSGAFTRVLYVSQISVAPPTIVCVVNRPELFTPNYERFLLNRLRDELPFSEVPIRLIVRGRRPREEYEQEGNRELDRRLLAEAVAREGGGTLDESNLDLEALFEVGTGREGAAAAMAPSAEAILGAAADPEHGAHEVHGVDDVERLDGDDDTLDAAAAAEASAFFDDPQGPAAPPHRPLRSRAGKSSAQRTSTSARVPKRAASKSSQGSGKNNGKRQAKGRQNPGAGPGASGRTKDAGSPGRGAKVVRRSMGDQRTQGAQGRGRSNRAGGTSAKTDKHGSARGPAKGRSRGPGRRRS
jgi:GTP-binding protein